MPGPPGLFSCVTITRRLDGHYEPKTITPPERVPADQLFALSDKRWVSAVHTELIHQPKVLAPAQTTAFKINMFDLLTAHFLRPTFAGRLCSMFARERSAAPVRRNLPSTLPPANHSPILGY